MTSRLIDRLENMSAEDRKIFDELGEEDWLNELARVGMESFAARLTKLESWVLVPEQNEEAWLASAKAVAATDRQRLARLLSAHSKECQDFMETTDDAYERHIAMERSCAMGDVIRFLLNGTPLPKMRSYR